MASLIARVTSTSPRAPLARLLTAPLGLDVWEVKPDHLVLQADEAQATRLEAMGYGVEQVQMLEPYLSTFATDAATTGYHSVASLEEDLRRLAEEHPAKTIVSLDPLICPCSTMNRIDLPHLVWSLESLVDGRVVNRIEVDPATAADARVALERMLALVGGPVTGD